MVATPRLSVALIRFDWHRFDLAPMVMDDEGVTYYQVAKKNWNGQVTWIGVACVAPWLNWPIRMTHWPHSAMHRKSATPACDLPDAWLHFPTF